MSKPPPGYPLPPMCSASLLFSEAMDGNRGAVLFRHACERGLEGVVSKRKGSAYVFGPTSPWRKVRCLNYARPGEEPNA
jgi:ATP-dependent DNA ligase